MEKIQNNSIGNGVMYCVCVWCWLPGATPFLAKLITCLLPHLHVRKSGTDCQIVSTRDSWGRFYRGADHRPTLRRLKMATWPKGNQGSGCLPAVSDQSGRRCLRFTHKLSVWRVKTDEKYTDFHLLVVSIFWQLGVFYTMIKWNMNLWTTLQLWDKAVLMTVKIQVNHHHHHILKIKKARTGILNWAFLWFFSKTNLNWVSPLLSCKTNVPLSILLWKSLGHLNASPLIGDTMRNIDAPQQRVRWITPTKVNQPNDGRKTSSILAVMMTPK